MSCDWEREKPRGGGIEKAVVVEDCSLFSYNNPKTPYCTVPYINPMSRKFISDLIHIHTILILYC